MGQMHWLFVFVICFSGRNVYCDPTLNMKDSLIGIRSHPVTIPCTYTPTKGYEEHNVEWSLHSEVIIHRTDSQDQAPLVKFRDRVEISQTPGDVSLTIKKLDISDKGNIKCKVTWKKNDGSFISEEGITVLKVLRVKPTTEKPKETIITTTQKELQTIKPTTEKPKETIITTHEELRTKATVTENHDTTISPERITGFRMPSYILIAILICVACIIAVSIFLFIKMRRKRVNTYELVTMNQLLALESAGNGGQSLTNETRASNHYELSKDPTVPVYEGIVLPYSNDYESLLVEKPPEDNIQSQK